MKKYIISILLLLGVLVPVSLFAQTNTDIDLDGPASSCVSLQSSSLRYKSRDINTNGEVSTLQDFLQSQNYLNSEPTGYFGILTFKAVKDFQSANGISPTGYVGPITRAKISAMTCSGEVTIPVIPSGPIACTMDAMQCPDGSYVGRSGQKCEFTKCPTPVSTCLPSGFNEKGFRCGCNSIYGFSATTGMLCGENNFSPLAINYFRANDKDGPVTILQNSSVTLSWSANNLYDGSCSIADSYGVTLPGASVLNAKGQINSGNISSSRTFTITCNGQNFYGKTGSVTASVTVKIESATCPGSVFDPTTGLPCGSNTFPPGCSSHNGWSTTTGISCSFPLPPGCSKYEGWSSTTGQACNGTQ